MLHFFPTVEESWQYIDFHAASGSRGQMEKGEDDSLCTDAVVDVVLLDDWAGLQHV
jgi:hypothetical protein